jgi:hypothetical protein
LSFEIHDHDQTGMSVSKIFRPLTLDGTTWNGIGRHHLEQHG